MHVLILPELELIWVLSDSAHSHVSNVQLQETLTLGHTHGLLVCFQASFRGDLVHRPPNRGRRWCSGSISGETLSTACPTGRVRVRAGTREPGTVRNRHLAFIYPIGIFILVTNLQEGWLLRHGTLALRRTTHNRTRMNGERVAQAR